MAIDTFPKQPAEVRYYDVTYADLLKKNADTPRVVDPYEVIVPAGLTLVASSLNNGVIKMLFGGGTSGTKYKVTTLLHTVAAQTLEHEIIIAVKDV